MRQRDVAVLAVMLATVLPAPALAQTTSLLPTPWIHAIRAEGTGELPFVDFRAIITQFSGFAPSKGGDQIAEYLAGRMREYGLEDVKIEGFPADGKQFFWAFLTEPAWDGGSATLVMTEPRVERVADFSVHRISLARFSTSADVTTELVDVGEGTSPADYEGKDVKGKIVLATGAPGIVHTLAVWGRGAAGFVWFRTVDTEERPHLIGSVAILPWTGPRNEPPGFGFSVSYSAGMELRETLKRGQRVVLQASVKATTGPGEYKQVSAAIPGSDPAQPEVWINAHDNHRNTGGANNLTGVGATIEVARVLHTLIAGGVLPRPVRTIRFLWGAEHYASVYNFYKHPDRRERVFSMLNVDMVGFHQERAKAIFRLYRLPYSRPHFLSDVAEEFVRSVGHANTISISNTSVTALRPEEGYYDPIFAPTGSRDQLHYGVEPFWGPSDHEDVAEASIGVPAVLYNDWPDPYIGTQEDDLQKGDPTQMRRAVLAVAATAYYLATVSADGVSRLGHVVLANAQARMAGENRRALDLVDAAPPAGLNANYREAINILTESRRRELATVDSLDLIARSPGVKAVIAGLRRQLDATHAANEAALREFVRGLAAEKKITLREVAPSPAELKLESLVPRRREAIRGPVNFFRPEYGAGWLRQKTGDDHFASTVRLAARGHYVLYETLNFADGRRTLREIRDAVSAEYGPIEVADIEQYFRFLESVGVVSMAATQH